MKIYFFASLILVFATAACSPEQSYENMIDQEVDASGIVGAEKFSSNDLGYKATVALVAHGEAFCTGTLIDPRIVLTAAHCIESREASDIEVRFANGAMISAEDTTYHDGYLSESDERGFFSISNKDSDDIGLIALKKAAPASAQVALLPKASLKPGKHKVRAFGIGASGYKKKDTGKMRMVNLEGEVTNDRPTKIAYLQTQGKGLCHGDSGGPQFIYHKNTPVVVAVSTSLNKAPAFMGRPIGDICRASGLSTLTGSYLTWISEKKKFLLEIADGGVPDCFNDPSFRQDMSGNFTNVDFSKPVKMTGEVREDRVDGQRVWVADFVGTGYETGKPAGGTFSFSRKCDFEHIDGFGR